jgi:soluble lytic murein transglycosylase-like protein
VALAAAAAALLTTAGCGLNSGRHARVPDELVPLFRSAAAHYGILSAAQLAAQARVESKFNPQAESRAGARGLMQFLPSTWEEFGVDGNKDGVVDPLEPADAILSAARYEHHLADLLRGVPGDRATLVIAAYNAGPGAVRAARGVPTFGETQAYVQKVRNWAERYREQVTPPTTSAG